MTDENKQSIGNTPATAEFQWCEEHDAWCKIWRGSHTTFRATFAGMWKKEKNDDN